MIYLIAALSYVAIGVGVSMLWFMGAIWYDDNVPPDFKPIEPFAVILWPIFAIAASCGYGSRLLDRLNVHIRELLGREKGDG